MRRGAHTIFHDMNKAQAVFANSKFVPARLAYTFSKGTRVHYKEAAELSNDPFVKKMTEQASNQPIILSRHHVFVLNQESCALLCCCQSSF
jgi:hypothetical protein